MDILLTIISGLFWIIVYEECIRLGFKQKTYCMPFFALTLNIAWESTIPPGMIFGEITIRMECMEMMILSIMQHGFFGEKHI